MQRNVYLPTRSTMEINTKIISNTFINKTTRQHKNISMQKSKPTIPIFEAEGNPVVSAQTSITSTMQNTSEQDLK